MPAGVRQVGQERLFGRLWDVEVERPKAEVEPPPEIDDAPDPEPETEAFARLGEEMVGDGPADPEAGTPVTAEDISLVLSKLDKDKDFSATGKPLVDSIREWFPGRTVTAKEVKASWEAFSNPA